MDLSSGLMSLIGGISVTSSHELRSGQLGAGDLLIDPAGLHEFAVGAEADTFAFVEDQDLLGVPDGADALGDDDADRIREVLRESASQVRVGAVVKGREGVVENEDLGRSGEGSRNGKPLLLAAGKVLAGLRQGIVEAAFALIHEFRGLRGIDGGADIFFRKFPVLLPEGEVLADAAGEEHGLLGDVADLVVEAFEGVILHAHAVQQDFAAGRVIEARDQVDQARLAAAGGADDREGLTLFHLEGDVLQGILGGVRITEGNVPEFKRPAAVAGRLGAFADLRLCAEDRIDAFRRDLRHRVHHENHDEEGEGNDHMGRIG